MPVIHDRPNAGGYTLTSIECRSSIWLPHGDTFSLVVRTADTNGGSPLRLHASMIAPGNFPAGESTITFSAPPNTMLDGRHPLRHCGWDRSGNRPES